MEAISVAFCKNFGFGFKNKLPWHIREDMKRFKEITDSHIVVMGSNTFTSINCRPLSNRFNIVCSKTPERFKEEEFANSNLLILSDIENTFPHITNTTNTSNIYDNKVFYIGGNSVYNYAMGRATLIYATIIYKEYECDVFFPVEKLNMYKIISTSEKKFSEEENCYFQFVVYKLKTEVENTLEENQYINLLSNIMKNGELKDDRTGVGTFSIFGHQMKFDISTSVPILTTKQVAWKTVIKELLWFLRGDTDSKTLEKEGVNIWKGNTSKEFLEKRGLGYYKEGDTGPLYSHALRYFGSCYKGCLANYKGKGYDQISKLIKQLNEDPNSRRHVITTFNPSIVDECVLMPCHGIAIQFYVSKNGKGLSCHVYCRSSDCFLGLPFNIASYSILTYIIAKKVNKIPDALIISTGDTHIYKNHVKQVEEQISRCCLPFPTLSVSDSVKNKDFEHIGIDDFELNGYIHHPTIKADMAI